MAGAESGAQRIKFCHYYCDYLGGPEKKEFRLVGRRLKRRQGMYLRHVKENQWGLLLTKLVMEMGRGWRKQK